MSEERNKPCDAGRKLGSLLAKLTDRSEPAVLALFPDHAQRCNSCAFRGGTFPNGCMETVLDALKCVVEDIPFMCHQNMDSDGEPQDLCAGYMIARHSLNNKTCSPTIKALLEDWDLNRFSGEMK